MAISNRPTSPHLTIYRPQISSVLSIMHRLSGIWLSFGMMVLSVWLYVAAYDTTSYSAFYDCFSSLVGQLALASWLAAFYYHLCSGIRHLFWDIGKGYALPTMNATGWLVIIVTLVLTLITWGFVQASVGA